MADGAPLPADDARVTRNGIALTDRFVILLSCQEVELGNIRQGRAVLDCSRPCIARQNLAWSLRTAMLSQMGVRA